jgi:Cys-rich protein (TIGR01571 family)
MMGELIKMGGWDIDLFDCKKNPIMFLWACCVPCGGTCMQAVDAKLTQNDKNAPLFACLLDCFCGCIGAAINRSRVREQLSIHDSILMDVLLSCFCGPCSITQEYIQVMQKKKGNEKAVIWEVYKG